MSAGHQRPQVTKDRRLPSSQDSSLRRGPRGIEGPPLGSALTCSWRRVSLLMRRVRKTHHSDAGHEGPPLGSALTCSPRRDSLLMRRVRKTRHSRTRVHRWAQHSRAAGVAFHCSCARVRKTRVPGPDDHRSRARMACSLDARNAAPAALVSAWRYEEHQVVCRRELEYVEAGDTRPSRRSCLRKRSRWRGGTHTRWWQAGLLAQCA